MAAQMIKNDEKMLRTCILYESVEGVSAFDAFKNFIKKMGDDVIEYLEFEFWYQRFSRGECDLDYDRSLELKSRGLLDLPKEVMQDVTELLTPIERLIFRKTCKPIRNIISRMNPGFHRINVLLQGERCILKLEDRLDVPREPFNHKITYAREDDAVYVFYRGSQDEYEEDREADKINGDECPITLALCDLFVILSNPELVLEELTIEHHSNSETVHRALLESLTHKIKVARVKMTINSFLQECDILPFLDSTVIREIELDWKEGRNGANWTCGTKKRRIQRLVEMDLWKGAESKIVRLHYNVSFPMEVLLDCKKLTIYLKFEARSMTLVIKWMKALLSSTVLQKADIRTQFSLKPGKLFGPDVIEQDGRRHFPIPGTNEVFEIFILGWYESGVRYSDLCIERKLNWLI